MGGNSSTVLVENVSKVGLGYGIAIAVGILVFVSTIMLATYVCVRFQRRNYRPSTASVVEQHFATTIVPQVLLMEENQFQRGSEWVIGGLEQSTINSYPKMVFCKKEEEEEEEKDDSGEESVCSICLCEYQDQEILRMMPECRHCFHCYCIDPWLRLNASCPICRTSPLPTPVSTPLSEVMPLASSGVGIRVTPR